MAPVKAYSCALATDGPHPPAKARAHHAALIWSVAEILRGGFKRFEYQKGVLPLTVLRRLHAVLTSRKAEFFATAEKVEGMEGAETALESIARTTNGHTFYNTSPLDSARLMDNTVNALILQPGS